MHEDIDTTMDTVKKNTRDEIESDLDLLHSKIDSLVFINHVHNSAGNTSERDKHLNIAIRDLPESDSDNVKSKIDKLFKDGLKFKVVVCEKAERKKSRSESEQGIIIAKLT
ncbi:hypothetical protein DPMN_147969 [Dreissena polymorpha]|uniref:Uncharacterized protein n=1 Tax=Dreissena polymorpha TaxID=45954 RepID=A0A9D4IZS8_DREPO|nr:hypothetical protein DPMN_147969 [Dreissena polymorpha]